MADFTEVITATPEKLVNLFYRIKPAPTRDFIVRIDWAATQLQLNHTQLVCALGFNAVMRTMSDILTLLGFSNFKALGIRRDELFCTDAYHFLPIDNVIDIYTCAARDPQFIEALRALVKRRLDTLEAAVDQDGDPPPGISYRIEIHALYNGGYVDKAFAEDRLSRDIGKYRLLASELDAILSRNLLPPSNIFFMDSVTAEEKRLLLERRLIPPEMIRNRLNNPSISDAEREVLSAAI